MADPALPPPGKAAALPPAALSLSPAVKDLFKFCGSGDLGAAQAAAAALGGAPIEDARGANGGTRGRAKVLASSFSVVAASAASPRRGRGVGSSPPPRSLRVAAAASGRRRLHGLSSSRPRRRVVAASTASPRRGRGVGLRPASAGDLGGIRVAGTALHVAAFAGHSEVVKWLIARDVPAGARDKNGGTPLHAAAFAGRLEVAALLVAAGADVEAADAKGARPLHIACLSGKAEIVRWLLRAGAAPLAETKDGMTPARLARNAKKDECAAVVDRHVAPPGRGTKRRGAFKMPRGAGAVSRVAPTFRVGRSVS